MEKKMVTILSITVFASCFSIGRYKHEVDKQKTKTDGGLLDH
jgi:hypothetical protein